MCVAVASICPILLAIGPWTWFAKSRLVPIGLAVIGAALLTTTFVRAAAVSLRLVRMPVATIELHPEKLVIADESLFRAPIAIARQDIDHISPAPSDAFAFGALGQAGRTGAPHLSLYPERSNCGVYLKQPIRLDGVLKNDAGGKYGILGLSVLRPPREGQTVDLLWLRTASGDGVRALRQWFDPTKPDFE
jgi:hypothetical protein